jgi:3' exoribonuclease, RNase T-like
MDIMLDLETLDNKPTSAIVAIGAVAFDLSGIRHDPFYMVINPESAEKYGTISASTFAWWCQQSEEARKIFGKSVEKLDLPQALGAFEKWGLQVKGLGPVCVWGNGADFDNVILGHAYKQTNMRQPWSFTHNRCFRTLKGLFSKDLQSALWQRYGQGLTHHNALDDAKRQANMCIDMLLRLNQAVSTK